MNPFFYKILKLGVWFRRLPYRRGYGIHSPFAFQLVTGVVYERGTFYAYAPLAAQRAGATLREKDDRLLLRLANDFQPVEGEATGIGPVSIAYLQAGCRRCRWRENAPAADALPSVTLRRSDGTLTILPGIHRSSAARRAWEALRQQPEARVTFDLYDFGLAYALPALNKEHYTINYL